MGDELRERIARALKFTTVHAPACPWGDWYWNRVLDANSRYKVADAVLAALSGEPSNNEPPARSEGPLERLPAEDSVSGEPAPTEGGE